MIDNPDKYQSFALNRIMEITEGEIFLRADAHCEYDDDYVCECVNTLENSKARNVGGAQRYKAKDLVQSGIALAVNSFLGNGGAKYMDPTYEGFGDTVFLGCFWTKDLKKLNGFNTVNVTNQDAELNLRLMKVFSSETIFISPRIKSWYYPRSTFKDLFKQYFRYGRGRYLTNILHGSKNQVRSLSPFLFLTFLLIVFTTNLIMDANIYSAWVVSLLLMVLLIEAVNVVYRNKTRFEFEIWRGADKKPGGVARVFSVSLCIILMQLGHFSGFLYQLVKHKIFRKVGW